MTSYGESALVRSMAFLADAQTAVSNNLANVNTDGFKRRSAFAVEGTSQFRDLLGAELPAVDFAETTDWTPGTLRNTESRFHASIEGEGMFKVQSSTGEILYTRRGEMAINTNGALTTPGGDLFLNQNGEPILMGDAANPATEFTISPNGTVAEEGGEGRTFGALALVRLDDMASLQPVGGGRFRDPTDQAASADFPGLVRQRSLEGSNVQTVDELVRMLEVQRTFQATQRALSSLGRLHGSFVAMMNR